MHYWGIWIHHEDGSSGWMTGGSDGRIMFYPEREIAEAHIEVLAEQWTVPLEAKQFGKEKL